MLICTLLSTGLFACGNEGNGNAVNNESRDPVIAAIEVLDKEIIDAHDEVMPKMALLNNTRKKLLKHGEDNNLSDDHRQELMRVVAHLEEADSLMWDWMHNYSRPDYKGNLDSVKNYLENEKVTVYIMRDKFESSMAEGDALITKYAGDE